ncbi:MAG: hypothetical protein WA322_22565 [Pseudolabrys sp.]
MNGAVMTLSRYYAREAIKRGLKAQGIKLQRVESCEITLAANRYIEDHPEIIAFAEERYRSLVASGRLKPPRQKKPVQDFRHSHNEGSADLQGLPLCKYRE